MARHTAAQFSKPLNKTSIKHSKSHNLVHGHTVSSGTFKQTNLFLLLYCQPQIAGIAQSMSVGVFGLTFPKTLKR